MTPKNKTIIAGLGIAGIAALGLIPIGPEPLTPNEWQALIQIYDYEIKQFGGVSFQDFKSQDLIPRLNGKIKQRVPKDEIVVIDGTELSETDYKNLRDNLLEKVEKKRLIEEVIK